MREFLFRAYDKGRKEYLSDGKLFIAINKSKEPRKGEIYLDVINNPNKYKERFIIEQYTGLTDKNGKKIFEGDILKYTNNDGEVCYLSVIFDECAFLIEEEGIINSELLTSYVCLGIEVAGNIHDNTDLLKGGGSDA